KRSSSRFLFRHASGLSRASTSCGVAAWSNVSQAAGKLVDGRPSPTMTPEKRPLAGSVQRWRNLCYKAPMNAIPPAAPRHVTIGNITVGNDKPLALIAGPCALESRAHAMEMCQALVEMTAKLGMGLIYKTSFDKANRTSIEGARGLGLEKGLPIMAELRERFGVPVLTD